MTLVGLWDNAHERLLPHTDHEVEIASYGNPPVNISVECITCSEVLIDFDRFEEEPNYDTNED